MTVLIPGLCLTVSLFLCANANFLGAPVSFSYPFYPNRFIQIHSPVLKSPEDLDDIDEGENKGDQLTSLQQFAEIHLLL